MLIRAEGKGFIIPHAVGAEFCQAIERTNAKNLYVYLMCNGDIFSMFAQSQIAHVVTHSDVGNGTMFQCGVESAKFIALFKKLYPDSTIRLTPYKNHIKVEEDNISVKLVSLEYQEPITMPIFKALSVEEGEWLATSITNCFSAIGKTKRCQGVLVDNTGSMARVLKFSEPAIRSVAHEKLSCKEERLVVSDDMAKALSGFKNAVSGVFWSKNHLGVRLANDVFFYMPLWADEYPPRYVDALKLREDLHQVEFTDNTYVFERDHLVNALDLISAVVGIDESQVVCESGSYGEGTDQPIWKLSATTFSQCEAQEVIQCIESGPSRMEPFKVHKKSFLTCLRAYGEKVSLYNFEKILVLTDSANCEDVTLLQKTSR